MGEWFCTVMVCGMAFESAHTAILAADQPSWQHACCRYTGKALHGLLEEMRQRPEDWRGRRVLFVHTGGLLGLYDKIPELQPLVEGQGRVHRLVVE